MKATLSTHILVFWLCAACAVVARAEPLVRVRAESRIELGVTHLDTGMIVSGALRDELGAPLAERTLALEARPVGENAAREPWRVNVATDDHGRFSLQLSDTQHDYRLLATFAGDATHRGVRVERPVERTRADVRLELRLQEGSAIDLDRPTFIVHAVAESDAGGDQIRMQLLDESGRVLSEGLTNDLGKLTLEVQTALLGDPGPGLIRIESLRDDRRAEAQTEARVVRRRAVQLVLHAEDERPESGNPIHVRGRVNTAAGPRAQVPVGLYAGSRHLETVVSAGDGTFEAELWIDAPPGPLPITARSEGDATGAYPPAESTVELTVVEARPLPVGWAAAALAAALLLAITTTARRSSNLASDEADEGRELPGASIRPAPRQGRRDRHRVHGRTLDAQSDEPICGATIALAMDKGEERWVLESDGFGRFASAVLPAGRAKLSVQARGYAPTSTELDIPHRGEWSSFVVHLESQRSRALSPFRRLLLRQLPSARAWGIWTTRESREWLSQRSPEQRADIETLAAEVERACYAAEPPSEEDVRSIERAAAALSEVAPSDAAADPQGH